MRFENCRTVAVLFAFVVSPPMAADAVATLAVAGSGVAALPARTASLPANVTQDPSAIEASLALDRPMRRLIQQALRDEGFDPGARFGPRTRAGIRPWQEARGEEPTGYLTAAEVAALRGAPTAAPARSGPVAAAPAVAEPAATVNAMRQDCERWNTEEFFETATSAIVTGWLAARASVAPRITTTRPNDS